MTDSRGLVTGVEVLAARLRERSDAIRWVFLAIAMGTVALASYHLLPHQMVLQVFAENALTASTLAALALLAGLVFAYRRGFAALHRAVLSAQEGLLEPVEVKGYARRVLLPVVHDYDALMTNLGTLFREMEQCQLYTIGERNRNDAILRSLPGALVTVDGDLIVTLSNRQAEELFGFAREDLRGRNLFDLLRLDEAGRELLREAFLYEQQVRNKEITLTVSDVDRHFTLNLTFFESQTVGESCAAIILQDVTEYKRLQEVTHHTEKLVAMGQLAAGVAHELNTPLGSIIGYAQLLNERVQSELTLAQYAQVIHGEAKRCAQIVDNLLAYARRDHCEPESCRINTVIAEVVESINNCQGKRQNMDVTTDLEGDPIVYGGAGQLDIVLVNLVINAIQATIGVVDRPRVIVRSLVESDAAVLSVIDNGPGVPPEARSRLFDPFFTTKEVGTGTGLGLAISQAIVSKIGGNLRYDAGHRGGARFEMRLPLVREA